MLISFKRAHNWESFQTFVYRGHYTLCQREIKYGTELATDWIPLLMIQTNPIHDRPRHFQFKHSFSVLRSVIVLGWTRSTYPGQRVDLLIITMYGSRSSSSYWTNIPAKPSPASWNLVRDHNSYTQFHHVLHASQIRLCWISLIFDLVCHEMLRAIQSPNWSCALTPPTNQSCGALHLPYSGCWYTFVSRYIMASNEN